MNSAVVIGINHYNTLGIIRSLGEKNISVILLLVGCSKGFVSYSKYIKKVIYVENDEQIIDILVKIASENDKKKLLFPTTDSVACLLDANYEQLSVFYHVPNAKGMLLNYMDKQKMNQMAAECDLLTPKQRLVILSDPQLSINFPVILKPLKSINGKKSDIAVAYNSSEFRRLCYEFLYKGYETVLAEEYIQGDREYMLEFIGARASDGAIYIPGWIEKIREYPISNGSTSYALLRNSDLQREIKGISSLLEKIDYKGIFDAEFKHTEQGNYFIEINLRNGAPGYVFTKVGCNIPYWWYNKELMLKTEEKRVEREYHFMCEHIDILNLIKTNLTLGSWLKQYSKADIKVFNSGKDLRPTIVYCLEMGKMVFAKLKNRGR